MIRVDITPDQIRRAQMHFQNFSPTKTSLHDGNEMLHGAIGEIVCDDYMPNWILDNTFEFDMVYKRDNAITADVKTRTSNFAPRGNWGINVWERSLFQTCQYYFFVNVHKSMKTAWLLGYMTKSEFMAKSKRYDVGDKIDNLYIADYPQRRIRLNQLHPFPDTKKPHRRGVTMR